MVAATVDILTTPFELELDGVERCVVGPIKSASLSKFHYQGVRQFERNRTSRELE